MLRMTLAVAAVCLSIPCSAQPARDRLMHDVRIDEDDVRPKFATLAATELKELLQVRLAELDEADRLIAAVEVALPAAGNTAYALVEFDEPFVQDSRGTAVAIERQSGLLDRHTNSVKLRLLEPGDEKPARFATVKGRVTVRYPLTIATRTIRSGAGRSISKLGASIDGPFVRYRRDEVAEASWLSDIDAVRAWDDSAKRLEREGTYPDDVNGDGFEMVAFHGAPATVEIDTPGKWATVMLEYELTFADPAAAKVKKALQQEEVSATPPAAISAADADQLLAAAVNGDVKEVRLLLAAGIDPSARGTSGRTALHVATATRKGEVVDLLLESGADVNATDANGLTPLFGLAARCEQAGTIAKLIARGADVNARGKSSITPLALAKSMNCEESVAALTRAGAR